VVAPVEGVDCQKAAAAETTAAGDISVRVVVVRMAVAAYEGRAHKNQASKCLGNELVKADSTAMS